MSTNNNQKYGSVFLKNNDDSERIIKLFTAMFKATGKFILIKDENGSIIYPKDGPTLKKISFILNDGEYTESDDPQPFIEIYDKQNNNYYKLVSTQHHIDNRQYSIELIEDISRQKFFEFESKMDFNTGVYNTRAITNKLEEFIINHNSSINSFSLVICDIDNFKKVNDEYSHIAGDLILKETADILKQHVGKNGFVGRYGGDEFILILKNYNAENALNMVEEIMNSIRNINIKYENEIMNNISISCGIYEVNKLNEYNFSNIDDVSSIRKDIFDKADEALYVSKEQGKDQVNIYSDGKQKEKN